jgi:hypothetical protein
LLLKTVRLERDGSALSDEEDTHVSSHLRYDPSAYASLQVDSDVRGLFRYIEQYTPQNCKLQVQLKPFIPEYLPAVAAPDCFLKAPRPDETALPGAHRERRPQRRLGLGAVDEPAAWQSNPRHDYAALVRRQQLLAAGGLNLKSAWVRVTSSDRVLYRHGKTKETALEVPAEGVGDEEDDPTPQFESDYAALLKRHEMAAAGLLNRQSPWERHTDGDHHYYWHHKDDVKMLEAPPEGVRDEVSLSNEEFRDNYAWLIERQDRAAAGLLNLQSPWIRIVDTAGRVFYRNIKTTEKTLEAPTEGVHDDGREYDMTTDAWLDSCTDQSKFELEYVPLLTCRDILEAIAAAPPIFPAMVPHPQEAGRKRSGNESNSVSSTSSSDDDDSINMAGNEAGSYDPSVYASLQVGTEVKDLFQYIEKYKPHDIDLHKTPAKILGKPTGMRWRPFVPDYYPAIGDPDAFLKAPRPDETGISSLRSSSSTAVGKLEVDIYPLCESDTAAKDGGGGNNTPQPLPSGSAGGSNPSADTRMVLQGKNPKGTDGRVHIVKSHVPLPATPEATTEEKRVQLQQQIIDLTGRQAVIQQSLPQLDPDQGEHQQLVQRYRVMQEQHLTAQHQLGELRSRLGLSVLDEPFPRFGAVAALPRESGQHVVGLGSEELSEDGQQHGEPSETTAPTKPTHGDKAGRLLSRYVGRPPPDPLAWREQHEDDEAHLRAVLQQWEQSDDYPWVEIGEAPAIRTSWYWVQSKAKLRFRSKTGSAGLVAAYQRLAWCHTCRVHTPWLPGLVEVWSAASAVARHLVDRHDADIVQRWRRPEDLAVPYLVPPPQVAAPCDRYGWLRQPWPLSVSSAFQPLLQLQKSFEADAKNFDYSPQLYEPGLGMGLAPTHGAIWFRTVVSTIAMPLYRTVYQTLVIKRRHFSGLARSRP